MGVWVCVCVCIICIIQESLHEVNTYSVERVLKDISTNKIVTKQRIERENILTEKYKFSKGERITFPKDDTLYLLN